MTFISYAQNFEDVMLWRALKNVSNGFYIDIGAWSPDTDSVTRHFYQNGWSGINVEPNSELFGLYATARTRDINLNIALSDREGEGVIYFSDNSGLSSMHKEIAESHRDIGFDVKPALISISTLSSVFEEYAENRDVHFMKLDVEGHERQVLLGNNWVKFRPWVLLVEATRPMSQIESFEEWEYVVLGANYTFAYADGLNRFYVANEHIELLESFKYPPNVFDGFKLLTQQQAEARAEQAEARAEQAEARAEQAEVRAEQAEVRAEQAEARAEQAEVRAEQAEVNLNELKVSNHYWWQQVCALDAERTMLCQSRSWRYTAPLRISVKWLRSGIKQIVRIAIILLHKLLARLIKVVLQQPQLKQHINQQLLAYPYLRMQLKKIAQRAGLIHRVFVHAPSTDKQQEVSDNLIHVAPHAREIYTALKIAIECKRGKN